MNVELFTIMFLIFLLVVAVTFWVAIRTKEEELQRIADRRGLISLNGQVYRCYPVVPTSADFQEKESQNG